ncbi:MAG: hypothetical protein IKE01_01555 [Clostridia bacterium]|nr:hypothetical protein [Clostridia bacterium]
MKFKELCVNTQERRYTEISGIKEQNIKLEGKPIKKVKENWIIVLAILALTIGLLLINFKLKFFLICIGLIAGLIALFIFGNIFCVTCDKDFIIIKQGVQNIRVPYDKVKNVFISKTSRWTIYKTYVLVVRCEDNMSFLREFEFPLLCSDVEEVSKFINNFKLATGSSSRYVQFEKRKSLRKIIENIATVVCVAIILWYMFSAGIINIF